MTTQASPLFPASDKPMQPESWDLRTPEASPTHTMNGTAAQPRSSHHPEAELTRSGATQRTLLHCL